MSSSVHNLVPADLVVTERLYARPARAPDLQAEAAAFHELSSLLLTDPQRAVARYVGLALELCRAGSAGLSLLRDREGDSYFSLEVVAGALSSLTGSRMPRDFSPCGMALEHGQPILLYRPARLFDELAGARPEIFEAFVVPLYDAGQVPLGALWVLAHQEEPAFDAEDARIMQQLSVQLVLALKYSSEAARHHSTVAELSHSLAAKDAFVHEVNHRVKNTIQTAVALLRLQRQAAKSSEAKEALGEAEKRLLVFSSVHQLLYQAAPGADSICMAALLEGIVDALGTSFSDMADRVRTEVSVSHIALHPDLAIPLALIANEALTNALKHAFPDGRSGTIRVRLHDDGPDRLKLSVDDNGIGMADEPQNGSLGMRLIRTFAKQIDGRLAIESESGTEVSVVLPHPG